MDAVEPGEGFRKGCEKWLVLSEETSVPELEELVNSPLLVVAPLKQIFDLGRTGLCWRLVGMEVSTEKSGPHYFTAMRYKGWE